MLHASLIEALELMEARTPRVYAKLEALIATVLDALIEGAQVSVAEVAKACGIGREDIGVIKSFLQCFLAASQLRRAAQRAFARSE